MNGFREIVERIKDEISNDVDGPVRYKHVADVLGLKPSTVRLYVVKDHMPYKHVLRFCEKREISVDWMLFGMSFERKRLQPDDICERKSI